MTYAIVGSSKSEAFKGGRGLCANCNSELIAKCGDVKIHHWAHKGIQNCDKWWENETEWHRNWKNNFPKEWQEIVHKDHTGERHIADIKTDKKWVIEFQHSYINGEERNSRISFYAKIVWVIDGMRRKTDSVQFQKILKESSIAPVRNVKIVQVRYPEESRLLKEWNSSGVPVFFDFHEIADSILWFLLPLKLNSEAFLIPFNKKEFIEVLNNDGFDELVNELIPNIRNIIVEYRRKASRRRGGNILPYSKRRTRRRRF